MINFKNPNVMTFIVNVAASFIGMVVALAWNGVIENLMDILKTKFPTASIFGTIVYAVFITFVAIGASAIIINMIWKSSDGENKD